MEVYDSTLSYVSGTSELPLIGSTVGDLFDRIVSQVPQNAALISRHQGLRYTYAELQDEVNRFARGLMALGIDKGDRVGIWSPNFAEWIVAQFATPRTASASPFPSTIASAWFPPILPV